MFFYFIIFIVIIVSICYKAFNNNNIKEIDKDDTSLYTKKEHITYNNDAGIHINGSYSKKYKILSDTELKFYSMIKSIANRNNLELFTQVAMYELIKTYNQRDFNRIRSKTIDYVLTDKYTRIKVCIELDDKSHDNPSRMERDKFVNALFSAVKIPLLRIPVEDFYIVERVENKIKEYL